MAVLITVQGPKVNFEGMVYLLQVPTIVQWSYLCDEHVGERAQCCKVCTIGQPTPNSVWSHLYRRTITLMGTVRHMYGTQVVWSNGLPTPGSTCCHEAHHRFTTIASLFPVTTPS